jgi:hypothetical protein
VISSRKALSLAVVVGVWVVLGVVASPTLAAGGHAFSSEFGAQGSAAGDFEDPTSVAVNEATGDVYVSDTGNNRVEYFTATGGYLGEFNVSSPGEIAIDNSTNPLDPSAGDVYVIDTGHDVIDKFSATGKFEGELVQTQGAEEGLAGVAVDLSGNVWLYSNNKQAIEFNDEGTYVSGFNTERSVGLGLAVDGTGHLYVITELAFARRMTIPDPQGDQVSVNDGVTGVAANEINGDLYTDNGEHHLIEHYVFTGSNEVVEPGGGTCVLGEQEPCSATDTFGSEEEAGGELSGAVGLAVNGSDGLVYVANSGHNDIVIYEAHEPPEAPHTEAATLVGSKTAGLHGELNPGGAPGELEYRFDYNLGSSCAGGGTVPVPAERIAEAKHARVEADATGLEPASQYTYCLVAINPFGSTPSSNEESFTTGSEGPTVTSESAGAITQTGATIAGEVNPNNEAVKWHIEYSTSPTLAGATDVPSPEGTIASGYGNVAVSEPVGDLAPNTSYYYRIVASNTGGGTRQGTIQSFVTLPSTPATEPASQIHDEEVTLNGSFNPEGQTTTYYFEYGESACGRSSCGTKTKVEGPVSSAGNVAASAIVATLRPFTSYRYRLVVENGSGPSYGPEETVATLPEAPALTTGPPASVEASTAIVAGEVVPQCAEGRYPSTTYIFEYGTTSTYGATGEQGTISAASCTTGGEAVTTTLSGLTPNTTYHYRLIAKNTGGETFGEDRTFTTDTSSEPSTTLPSGFSLTGVSPTGPLASASPNLTGLTPLPAPATTISKPAKPATKAQKLNKALTGCRRDKGKVKRVRCERSARATYGAKAKK